MKVNFYRFRGYHLFLAIALFLNFGVSAQTIRYVKQGAGGDGSSWGDPSGSIYGMVEISQPNDEIWVAEGNYTEDFLFMTPEVKVYGGFAASGNPTMAQRNWAAHTTTIFGNPFFYAGSPATVLDGFTVVGEDNENGVWVQNSSPTLRNLNIKAPFALRLESSASLVSNVQITGQNYGINAYGSTAHLLNVTIVYNWQYDIETQGSALTISNSLIGSVSNMSEVVSANSIIGTSMAGVFIDDSAGNFTPSPYGAAYNTGNTALFPNAATAKDLGGNARVSGSAIDMGAYEYSPPTVRYVKQGGTGDGSSWALASGDLQQMIYSSNSDDAVWVAGGSYSPGAGQSFSMKQGVEIYGGFPNTGDPSMADRNPALYEVLLNGNGSRVFDNVGLDNTSILDGFTITGGGGVINGAGMQNTNASPLINRCIFRNNTAGDWGGGMYNNTSNPTITNSLFHHNVGGGGGASFDHNSSVNYINVTFTENSAGNGGAIHTYNGGAVTASNCIFWNNHASGDGDQFFSLSSMTVNSSIIPTDSGNLAGAYTLNNCISGDPGFEDPAANNFNLTTCGPATNIGNNDLLANAATAKDLGGNVRLDGSNIDAGAYEFQLVNGTPVPTAPGTQIFEPGATVSNLEATGSGIQWYNVSAGGAPLAGGTQLFSQTYYVSQTIDGCESARVAVAVTVNYLPIRYVKQDASGLADGSSWADASNDLQAMINADGVQQVWVAQGEYLTPLDVAFTMKDNVKIYGGFPASGTPGMTDRNIRQFETKLVGNGNRLIDNNNNSVTNAALLDGFTILQGYTDNNGGGISNINAYPTIANCMIRDNYAANWAGGIYNEGNGSTKIVNCVFYNNSASGGGAAFDNLNAAPVYTNVTFANNDSSQNGGAIHTYQDAVSTLQNCIVWGNYAEYDGDQVLSAGGGSVTANYTIIINDGENVYGPFNGANILSENPLFTSPGGANYTLKAGSPARDSGNSALYPGAGTATDLAGNPRLDGAAIDIGAYEYKVSCTIATAWDGNGWSNGTPVSNSYSVTINGNYNSAINGEIIACSIIVNSGDVVIAEGNNFKIKGAVTIDNNNVTFTVQQNANLIQIDDVDNTGTINVIKESAPIYRLDYALWSSPVAGQKLKAFSPQTLDNRFYTYNPLSDAYATVAAPATTDFTEGKSYLIRVDNTHPAFVSDGIAPTPWEGTFIGVPNNGNVNVLVTGMADGINGYNGIGNPYPSSINIAAFFEVNQNNLAEDSPIYFWRKKNDANTSSYASLTLAGYNQNSGNAFGDSSNGVFDNPNDSGNWVINPGQGFIVQAASNTVTFNNEMRVAVNNGQMFRSAMNASDKSRLWLNLTNADGAFGQATIAYTPFTTLGRDFGWDGKALTDGDVAIYSLAGDNEFGIQARPAFDPADEVSMECKITTAGNYTISLDHFDGVFAEGQEIYLRDNVLGITHNLESPYQFTTDAGIMTGRFDVVYAEALGTDIPAFNSNSIIVYKQGGAINISTGNVDMKSVAVYDIRGRLLYSANAINKTETAVTNLQVQEQMLIVEVTTVGGIKASKKIVF